MAGAPLSSVVIAIYAHPNSQSPILRMHAAGCYGSLARLEVGWLSPAWTGSGFRPTDDYSRAGGLLGGQRNWVVLPKPSGLDRECYWCHGGGVRVRGASGGRIVGLPSSGSGSWRFCSVRRLRFCGRLRAGAVYFSYCSRSRFDGRSAQDAQGALHPSPWLALTSLDAVRLSSLHSSVTGAAPVSFGVI